MPQTLRLPPLHLLACPRCGADTTEGLDPHQQRCNRCNQTFFDLAGLPCWFNVGLEQKKLWQSLYGLAKSQARRNLQLSEQQPRHDMLTRTRARAEQIDNANRAIIAAIEELLDDVQLGADIAPEFANYDAGRMLQYFELLLRDWAWDSAVPPAENENALELNRLRQAIEQAGISLGHTLVLGAGAGRLSWDIQRTFNPDSIIALDTNPVLIAAAHRLVALEKPWQLTELHPNPQIGLPQMHSWTLAAPQAESGCRDRWFAMGANAWSPPLKAGCFDTLITPWFIDVNGKDVRLLIAQIQKLLKPGGNWINTGPLLYGSDIPPARRYSTDEIVELSQVAGFEFRYQATAVSPYLKTPLSQQLRTEQVWTFIARAPTTTTQLAPTPAGSPPAWILLPHLAIPRLDIPAPQDPVLQRLLAMVDGQTSINAIAAQIAPNLPAGQDPVALVQAVFVEYLLQSP